MEFYDKTFWYTDPTGTVLHNAKLRKGWVLTVSSLARTPGLENATTRYTAFHRDREKEALWEKIRSEEFADKPTRMKAMFLFTSEEDVETAMQTWFKGEDRDILAVQVPKASNLHIADSKHLDAPQSDWDAAARLYWSGNQTDTPLLEAVLDGEAFIRDWEALKVRFR
ncbi:hypothetical protein [Rhizobium mesoamericanum]|uniref:hypothetical protein n=1 Tax=Rhizobium mesoamericanum TaxID=1079800 RepID=UPI00048EB7EE|nr:hypothetical protein [Rhizobium mesoamericanum]